MTLFLKVLTMNFAASMSLLCLPEVALMAKESARAARETTIENTRTRERTVIRTDTEGTRTFQRDGKGNISDGADRHRERIRDYTADGNEGRIVRDRIVTRDADGRATSSRPVVPGDLGTADFYSVDDDSDASQAPPSIPQMPIIRPPRPFGW